MSLVDNGANGMVMPVSPMGGNAASGGDWIFWFIILFFFGFMGNGWGNGNNGNSVQRGFDQQALVTGQNNILQAMGANQIALNSSINAIAMALQNCCCENRAAVADVKYTIANEAAATRAAITAGNQLILDKLCQQEIDALKEQNSNLRTQLNMASLAASQAQQTADIKRDLNPAPIPAYMVQNPNSWANSCTCSA